MATPHTVRSETETESPTLVGIIGGILDLVPKLWAALVLLRSLRALSARSALTIVAKSDHEGTASLAKALIAADAAERDEEAA